MRTSALFLLFFFGLGCSEAPVFVGRGSDGDGVPAFRVSAEDLSAARADTDRYEAVAVSRPRVEDTSLFKAGGCDTLPRASFLRSDAPFEWVTQAYQGLGVKDTPSVFRLAVVEHCIQGFRTLEGGKEQFLFFVGTWPGSREESGSIVSIRQVLPPGMTVVVENPAGAGSVTVRLGLNASAVQTGSVPAGQRRSFTVTQGNVSILEIERPSGEGFQAPVRLYAHFGGSVNGPL